MHEKVWILLPCLTQTWTSVLASIQVGVGSRQVDAQAQMVDSCAGELDAIVVCQAQCKRVEMQTSVG